MSLDRDFAAELGPDTLAIYLFHGVVEENAYAVRNYNNKHLDRATFRRIVGDLAAAGEALALDDMLAIIEAGEPFPANAFAVTFDDGFANNLTVALPVLRDLGVPATIYLTSDFIDSNRMSWIDRIEWALETTGGSVTLGWRDAPQPAATNDEKRAVLDDIRAHVKSTPDADGDGLATDIQAQLGLGETWSTDDPLDLKLTWDQVRELMAESLITLGGHSHSHAVLSFLDEDGLAHELDTSLGLLAEHGGVGPTHYSYPEGLAHCYSPAVIDALKARGVRCCPTAIDGVNGAGTDPFELRRVSVM